MKNRTLCFLPLLAIGLLADGPVYSQETTRFRADDPLTQDHDRLPIPQPEPVRVSQIFDFAENTFARQPK